MEQSQLGCSWGWRGSSYFEDWRKCTLSFTVHGSNSQPGIQDKKNYMSNFIRVREGSRINLYEDSSGSTIEAVGSEASTRIGAASEFARAASSWKVRGPWGSPPQ